MLLVIDIGNTSTVLGFYRNSELIKACRVKTGDYTEENIKVPGMSAEFAFVSSVVPSVNSILKTAVQRAYGCEAEFLDTHKKTGLNICTDNPEKTGADLICGAAAAFYRYKKPVVVFDLGTATTVCAVDRSGCYLGHAIYPGVRTSFDALHAAAEQLPEIDSDYTDFDLIGKNTVSSMKSGVITGAACFIDGMAERYCKVTGDDTVVVVTGGLSPVILPHCTGKYIYDENLLLDGLRIICNLTYNRNY